MTRDRDAYDMRDDAEAALAGAIEHLRTVLEYVETVDGEAIDKGYPEELPSFDEVVAALMEVRVRTLPSFDDVEAVGLDGTLRGLDGREPGKVATWTDIARSGA